MTRFVVASALVGLLATTASAEVKKTDVDVKTSDGVVLKGTYFSPGRPGPAVLLLHQCNMDRHSWDGLADDLAGAGMHVLTFDFRGYGDTGDKPADAAARRTQVAEKWPGDVDAAYTFLLNQNGVDKSAVAAGGASCAVAQAGSFASRHHEVKSIVMLSPAGDPGKAYIAQTPALAILGAATESDSIVAAAPQNQAASTACRCSARTPSSNR